MKKTLGTLIHDYRMQHALSQADFARQANLSQQKVSRIEAKGFYNPTLLDLEKIAHAMFLTVPELLSQLFFEELEDPYGAN
ncbi:helix-turn-helix transcriptional regulator [Leuconostocaceae bacterium ESL0958]|nr:helix-turn-helix transcriptional regulator [Leuconostocaceae bacterium ESL0958]